MSRYIEAEWLKEHTEVISYEGMWHETETDEFVSVENINSAPSIDIVRCGECKHWADNEDYDCEIHSGAWQADDSCSYGERKEQ